MPSIFGTSLANLILPGQSSAGVIGLAGAGDDTIDAGAGNDTIDAGAGNDYVAAGDDADSVQGGAGNDTIDGGLGADTLVGGTGWDVLRGGEGNDRLDLSGNGAGDLWGRADGGDGADLLIGHATAVRGGNVFLMGGAGNDTIQGNGLTGNIADYADKSVGINATLGATGTVKIGTEIDTLQNVVRIRGTAYNDTLKGSSADETFMAGRGNDSISGGFGADVIDYSDEWAGVSVNLATGQAVDGGGGIDTITGIEHVTGSNYNDTLTGNSLVNIFRPLGGNDSVDGGTGWDSVRYDLAGVVNGIPQGIVASLDTGKVTDSWGGVDTLKGIEEIAGSNLADDITGSSSKTANTHIKGLEGNDTLRAPVADSRVMADYRESPNGIEINLSDVQQTSSAGNVIAAGTGRDGHGFIDTFDKIQGIIGSEHDDWIRGGDQTWEYGERLLGWSGNDTIIGGWGDDSIFGGSGVDVLVGNKGMDFIFFDAYSDSEKDTGVQQGAIASLRTGIITNDGWGNTEYLGADNEFEVLVGTTFGDDFEGKKIDDAGVIAEQMECQLRGGQGADTLRAAAGDERWVSADYMTDEDVNLDKLGVTVDLVNQTATDGWGFQDVLVNIGGTRGSAFKDMLIGNAGDNWFRGEAGSDTIIGGDGTDLVSYFSSDKGAVVDLELGTAEDGYSAGLSNGAGTTDLLISIEQAVGAKAAADTLLGSSVDNRLSGFGGNDRLDGRGGNDTLLGGMGADTIIGGTGQDKLTGGEGADRFLWRNAAEGGDTVLDFTGGSGGDRLVFERAGFDPTLSLGSLSSARFVSGAGAQATGSSGQFLYDTATGKLSWDADGAGAGAAQLIATLTDTPWLVASDLQIIA
jgi:Ca2+-binding RTX toxin-like protein